MTPQEKAQLEELITFKRQLENSSTIPLKIDQSFRKRFVDEQIQASTISATLHNVVVNEAGSGTYSVLGAPAGYAEVVYGGVTHYIPIY